MKKGIVARFAVALQLAFLIGAPSQVSAQKCRWSADSPVKLQGNCNFKGMATFFNRSSKSHAVKITNRGRKDDRYTVYESNGCSDSDRYDFCKQKGWAMTATPIDLGSGRIALLTAGHFDRSPNSARSFARDIALFLPGSYELAGTLKKLNPVPISGFNSDDPELKMFPDIRQGSKNIALQITLKPFLVNLYGIQMMVALVPRGLGDYFGGESGGSLLYSGKVWAVFNGFLEQEEKPYALMSVVPISIIRELLQIAKGTAQGTRYVKLP